MNKRIKTVAMLAVVFALLIAGGQPAQSQGFYQGKAITFIVGASAGGSFDSFTRRIGRRVVCSVRALERWQRQQR